MENTYYYTSDIQIASTLLASGCDFLHVDGAGRRKDFVFIRNKRLMEVEKLYWRDAINLPPRKLFGAFKELKNKLYQ